MMTKLPLAHRAFTALTLAVALLSLRNARGAEKPNILIVLVDDMGWGDPGCYNAASKIPTLHIDGLAREGLRFTDAHAPGAVCHASRYGLLTGRYPFRTDISVWPTQPLIDEGRMTIASLLKAQGYRTAMVGKWHLGFRENGYDQPLPGGPVDCGFDTFFGLRASTDIPPYFYIRGDRAVAPPTAHIEASSSEGWSPIQGAFWRAGGIAPGLELRDVLPRFTEEAVGIIAEHAREKRPRAADALPRAAVAAHAVAARRGVCRAQRRGDVWRFRDDGGCRGRARARGAGGGEDGPRDAGHFHLRQRPRLV